jgi:hypothetical protein
VANSSVIVLPYHRHIPSLAHLTNEERLSFANILSRVTKRYDNLFSCSFAYSMGIHQRPSRRRRPKSRRRGQCGAPAPAFLSASVAKRVRSEIPSRVSAVPNCLIWTGSYRIELHGQKQKKKIRASGRITTRFHTRSCRAAFEGLLGYSLYRFSSRLSPFDYIGVGSSGKKSTTMPSEVPDKTSLFALLHTYIPTYLKP